MNRITIADVARRAGVSISTVSYALSGKRPISPRTTQKIQDAIRELGFHPNPSARRLASREKTRNIGFVLPLQGSELTGLELKFIAGAARVINQADYTFILLAHSDRDPANLLRFSRSGMVDGFILMEVHMQDERVQLLRQEGLPFVLIGRCQDTAGLAYVDLDIHKSMDEFFASFVARGRKVVAFLHKDDSRLGLSVRTVQEFQSASSRYGIRSILKACPLSSEAGETAMNELLDEHPGIDAVLIWNELPGVGVAKAAKARGLGIPENFSIICLAQSAFSILNDFSPVMIDIRAEEMAAKAAEIMIQMLEGRPIAQTQILLAPKLIPPAG